MRTATIISCGVVVGWWAATLPLRADDTLTYGETLAAVLSQSPELAVLASARDVARADERRAKAILPTGPELQFDTRLGAVLGTDDERTLSFGIAQPVELSGARKLRVQAAAARQEAAAFGLTAERLRWTTRVQHAFSRWHSVAEQLATLSALAEIQQSVLAAAEKRSREGLLGAIELQLLRADAADIQVKLLALTGERRLILAKLGAWLRRDLTGDIRIEGGAHFMATITDAAVLLAELDRHPERLEDTLALRAKTAASGAIKRSHWPQPTVNVGVSNEREALVGQQNFLTLGLSLPLNRPGTAKAHHELHRAELNMAEAEAAIAARQRRLVVSDTLNRYDNARAVAALYRPVAVDAAATVERLGAVYRQGSLGLEAYLSNSDRIVAAWSTYIEAEAAASAAAIELGYWAADPAHERMEP